MREAKHFNANVLNSCYGEENNFFYINICGLLSWSHMQKEPTKEQLRVVAKFDNLDAYLRTLVTTNN